MTFRIFFITGMLSLTPMLTNAGTLVGNTWKPSDACGVKPEVPVVNDKDADAYNKSVKAINEWQQKASIYYDCLVKEANIDNGIIADTANRELAVYKQAVESISANANAAKQKLDKR